MRRLAALLAVAAAALAQSSAPKTATARKPAAVAALPSYSELKFPPLAPVALPKVQSFTLPSGMQLLLMEEHELPLINGVILVRAGSALDPPDQTGLAAFAVQVMLSGGTAARPDKGLARRFQDLGAEITGQVTANSLALSFSGLKENSSELLATLKEVLLAPAFPQDRIDLMKIRLRTAIAHRNDDASTILRREFAGTIFGKQSPYGAQQEYSDVDRINRPGLVEFHRRYFFPANVTLALAGDFDSTQAKDWVDALFADWKNNQPPVPAFPAVSTAAAPGKFVAVKRDAKRAIFAIGQAGSERLDKDNAALEVMAGILGGPHARLNQLLRGEAEGVSAAWTPGFGRPGLFEVSGTVPNPFYTTKVLRTVYDQLNRIRVEPVSEAELRSAKAIAVNRLAFAFDNQLALLPRIAEYQYFHIPPDYTRQYQGALEAVTGADVLRVARERLDPAAMTTVVVANPTAFESPLESLGGTPVHTIDLTIPPSTPQVTTGDAASEQRARQLLARAQKAMGGADRLAAVTDYEQEIAYQFAPGAGGEQASMMERWMAPGYIRQDTTYVAGKVSVYCDGKIGWVSSGRNVDALLGVQLKQVQGNLFRMMFPLLLSDRLAGRRLTALDEQTVEISDGAGNVVKVVFDPATGLPKNELYDAPTAAGMVPVIETYSDYRQVGGIEIPFQVAIELSGKKFQDLTIQNIRLNAGLKIADLETRP